MKPPLFIVLLFITLAGAARADASLDIAAQLARSGAPQLALARAERDQPAPDGSPQWWQWESLRLSLLADLGRDEEAMQRYARLPGEIPPSALGAYRPLAQAALRRDDSPLARRFLAKWLWGAEMEEGQLKEARRLVIESYLAQRRPDAAYLAMLRFRQDYPAAAQGETARFAEQLLLAGGLAEAANWLPQLDEASPLKLLLRLRARTITPDAAIAVAWVALDSPPPEAAKGARKTLKAAPFSSRPGDRETYAWWSVIAQAAALRKTPALRIEALEHQLNLPRPARPSLFGADAGALWQAYDELALAEANHVQLLIGEETDWLDLAVDAAATSPRTARALFAYLARHATADDFRATARARLAALLLSANLDTAAVRLFSGDALAEAALLEQLPPGGGDRRSGILIAFGQEAAARDAHGRAAEYYLRAGGAHARRLAADSLLRAGMAEDARRQFGEMLK